MYFVFLSWLFYTLVTRSVCPHPPFLSLYIFSSTVSVRKLLSQDDYYEQLNTLQTKQPPPIPASLMYHMFKYILLLQVKIKATCNCEKKVIFNIADTVNPISQSKPNCFITITNIIHHYCLIIRIKNKPSWL